MGRQEAELRLAPRFNPTHPVPGGVESKEVIVETRDYGSEFPGEQRIHLLPAKGQNRIVDGDGGSALRSEVESQEGLSKSWVHGDSERSEPIRLQSVSFHQGDPLAIARDHHG